jgi:hypothetical protein
MSSGSKSAWAKMNKSISDFGFGWDLISWDNWVVGTLSSWVPYFSRILAIAIRFSASFLSAIAASSSLIILSLDMFF